VSTATPERAAGQMSGPGQTSTIPLVDLAAQHAQVAEEIAAGWAEVLARTAFVGGP
jgi:hypothetical protein